MHFFNVTKICNLVRTGKDDHHHTVRNSWGFSVQLNLFLSDPYFKTRKKNYFLLPGLFTGLLVAGRQQESGQPRPSSRETTDSPSKQSISEPGVRDSSSSTYPSPPPGSPPLPPASFMNPRSKIQLVRTWRQQAPHLHHKNSGLFRNQGPVWLGAWSSGEFCQSLFRLTEEKY